MSAKDDILAALRRRPVEATELPPAEGPWIVYDDPWRQFSQVLSMVGGALVMVRGVDEINAHLAARTAWTEAKRRLVGVSGVEGGNVDLAAIDDPRSLEDVEFAVLPGEIAVAENGAVWVHDANLRHRVAYFLVQHLALVVHPHAVVHNLHQAYERLTFDVPRFGAFISGPSKTADIEQSLVIGAHGPRSHTVFVLGNP